MRNGGSRRVIVAVASGKGGVGKTTLALALAHRLCEHGHTVTLVDGDLGGKNLTAWLAPPGVRTVGAFSVSPEYLPLKGTGELQVLSICDGCEEGGEDGALASRLIRNVRRLGTTLAIVDLGPGTALFTLECFLAADVGIVVTPPEPAAVRSSFSFVEACVLHGLQKKAVGRPEAKTLLRFLRKRGGEHAPLRSLLSTFNRGRHCLSSLLEELLQQMRVGIIVNCVRDSSDRRVGQALRALLLDLLGLQAELWGYVPFHPELRHLVRTNENIWQRIQLFDGCLAPASGLIGLAATGLRRESRPTIIPDGGNGNGRLLVCSTRCACWHSCDLRRGGYPCPITPLGELKTLLTSLAE